MEGFLCCLFCNPIIARCLYKKNRKLWQIFLLNTDLIMSRWCELFPQVAGGGVGGWYADVIHKHNSCNPAYSYLPLSASHPPAPTDTLQTLKCLQLKVALLRGQFGKLNYNFFFKFSSFSNVCRPPTSRHAT